LLAEQNGIALASAIGVSEGAGTCYNVGINALTSILKGPSSLEEAISDTEKLVEDEARRLCERYWLD